MVWLFLGCRVLRKIAQIVREEMDAIGSQELRLPQADDAVAVARELRSYRQLPQIWYAIGRAAMAAYSFDTDACVYRQFQSACERILTRCQVPFAAIEAPDSHQFLVESNAGESCIVQCPKCGYAATLDRAAAIPSAPLVADPEGDRAPEEFHTPGPKTIADVAEFTGLPETTQMKSLVLVAAANPVLALVRGDHQLSEAKLAAALGVLAVRPAHADEIRAWFGAGAGSLGPVGIANMRVLADEELRGRRTPPQAPIATITTCVTLLPARISSPSFSTFAAWSPEIPASAAARCSNSERPSRPAIFATSARPRTCT